MGYMKPTNWAEAKAKTYEHFIPMTPGAYVCRIDGIIDHPDQQYFEINYEVVEGECKGESARRIEKGWQPLSFRAYYTAKSAGLINKLIARAEDSNSGYIYPPNEEGWRTLVGKGIGLLMGNVWREKAGKMYLNVVDYLTVKQVRDGDYIIPEDYYGKAKPVTFTEEPKTDDADDGELPF